MISILFILDSIIDNIVNVFENYEISILFILDSGNNGCPCSETANPFQFFLF